MSAPRELRSLPNSVQGPDAPDVTPTADRVRDTLAVRCGELEMGRPEVLDLVAEALAVLQARLAGRVASLAGNRSPKYMRETLRGEHPLTLEDLARLAIDVPTAVAPALGVLAERTGYQMVPVGVVSGPTSALAACTEMLESVGRCVIGVQRVWERAGEQIPDVDRRRLHDESDRLMRRVCAFQRALGSGSGR